MSQAAALPAQLLMRSAPNRKFCMFIGGNNSASKSLKKTEHHPDHMARMVPATVYRRQPFFAAGFFGPK
jgi:hypothetical protein